MQIETLKFLMASDSEVGAAALVNGVAIATVNRDEHGPAGEQVLRSVLEGLSKLSGVRVEEDEVDEDEFRERT